MAGHGIDHQKRVARRNRLANVAHLLHHLGVDGQATGGVDDEHIATKPLCFLQTEARGFHRVAWRAEHGHTNLGTEHTQLLDCGRALQVGTHEHGLATLFFKPRGQLGSTRGFARTLQTGHQHHGGWLAGIGDLQRFATQQRHQFGLHRFDHLLGGVERFGKCFAHRLFADACQHVAHHGDVYVGFEQCGANFGENFVDVGFAQATAIAQFADDRTEAVTQRIKHQTENLSVDYSSKSAATNSCGSKGAKSATVSPSPTNLMGIPSSVSMANTMPPLAEPSSLVSTTPVTCVASAN